VISADPLRDSVAAVSVGMVDGRPVLDLAYEEDARADVDFNVVMTGSGALVEVQGTAEGEPFSRDQLNDLVDLAEVGVRRLTEIQRRVLADTPATP
jgi:ribonuclease PH